MSIETVVNEALDLIGYKRHIGNIHDGSLAARIALNAWGDTRNEILISMPWEFARANTPLVLTTLTPITPWRFEYYYPDNCIKLLMVKPASVQADPQPVRWMETDDPRLPDRPTPRRCVVANISNAVAVHTAVPLIPDFWPSDFRWSMIQALAKKLEASLEIRNEPRGRRQSGAGDNRQPE